MAHSDGDDHGYFRRIGADQFAPTPHATGAWTDADQHIAPMVGLLVHEMERFRDREERPALQMGRLSIDILGTLPMGEFDVVTRVIRPGRSIELMEATAILAGRPTVTARAWYLMTTDSAGAAGGQPAALPAPEDLPEYDLTRMWEGGLIRSLDVRRSAEATAGSCETWLRTPLPLVVGEDNSDLARFVGLIDVANGISPRKDPTEWMFPNVDICIHFYRQPRGDWTGLEVAVTIGDAGLGVTSSVLHDLHGPVGRVEQLLTVRPQPPVT